MIINLEKAFLAFVRYAKEKTDSYSYCLTDIDYWL